MLKGWYEWRFEYFENILTLKKIPSYLSLPSIPIWAKFQHNFKKKRPWGSMTTSKRDESESQNFPGLPGNSYWHITDIRPLNPKRIRVKFLFVDISLLWQRRFPCLLLICTFTKIVAKLWPQSNERCIFLKNKLFYIYQKLSFLMLLHCRSAFSILITLHISGFCIHSETLSRQK